MDIPDFMLVIQWRAENLTMCSLMQRLGRAARNPSLNGTFVLFAESKYFDYQREAKAKKKTNNAVDQAQHPCNSSQPHEAQLGSVSATGSSDGQAPTSITEPIEDAGRPFEEIKKERRAVYSEHYRSSQLLLARKDSKKNTEDCNPAVDDTINAGQRGFVCRRQPGEITFGNDTLSEWFYLLISSV